VKRMQVEAWETEFEVISNGAALHLHTYTLLVHFSI